MEMTFSQDKRLRSLGLFKEPLQGNRSIDDRDRRASRNLRSTSTLLNPFSGFPQRLRSSSIWRAALRITSRSLTRDSINSSTLIFDSLINTLHLLPRSLA